MAELLIKAIDATHIDPVKDRRGCYKRGYIVSAHPDGFYMDGDNNFLHAGCQLPTFVVIKIPLISPDKVMKYKQMWMDNTNPENPITVQRRIWKLRWDDLPQAAKNKLKNFGFMIIKATDAYTGSYDYTWTQVKQYFRNLETELDETEEL